MKLRIHTSIRHNTSFRDQIRDLYLRELTKESVQRAFESPIVAALFLESSILFIRGSYITGLDPLYVRGEIFTSDVC